MSRTTTIRDLLTEIIYMVTYHLDAVSLIWLQRLCRAFLGTIPSPTHRKLIEAETDDFGL
jgi:hypothetical protein